MGQELRVGIIGANPERGWARIAHIPALNALPSFRLAGVAEPTPERGEASAKAFGADRAFADGLELARSPDIDLVVVTVRVPDHFPVVMAALEADKHIYCEWPLGRTIPESREMADRSQSAKGTVMIGLQALSSPAVRRAGELVREGALGTLLNMRVFSPTAGWAPEAPATYRYLQDRENGATLATIAGGHTLAVMEFLAGRIADVQAQNTIRFKTVSIRGTGEQVERTSPDHMAVVGRHDGGCVSILEVVGHSPDKFRLELVGTKGTLAIDGDGAGGFQTGALRLSLNGSPVDAGEDLDLTGQPLNMAHCYARMAAAIAAGQGVDPDFKTAEGLAQLLVAIDRSSDEGRRVEVEGR